jgi:hypothetical protein
MLEARKRGEESYKLLGGRDVDRNLFKTEGRHCHLAWQPGRIYAPTPDDKLYDGN